MTTIAQAKATLTFHGMVLRKTDGEYRVNFRGGKEATAYYTTDIDDAVATGIKMMEKAHRDFVQGPGEQRTENTTNKWRLICNETGEIVRKGDKRTTFRGETVVIGGFSPPHKPESTGKVELIDEGCDSGLYYYPGVVGCHYEECM